jgi:hypothetical protein
MCGTARLSGGPRAANVPALLRVTDRTTVQVTLGPLQHNTYTQQAHRRQLRRLQTRGRAQTRAPRPPAAAPASPWSARARPAAASQTPQWPLPAHGHTQRASWLARAGGPLAVQQARTRCGRRGRVAQHLHGHRADPAPLAARPFPLATRLGRPRRVRARSRRRARRGRSALPASQRPPQQQPGHPGRTGARAPPRGQPTSAPWPGPRRRARAAGPARRPRPGRPRRPPPSAPLRPAGRRALGRLRGARRVHRAYGPRQAQGCKHRARQVLTASEPRCLALRGAPPPPLLCYAALLRDGAPLPFQLFLGCLVPGGERHLLGRVVIVRRVRAGGRRRRPRAHAGRLHCLETAFERTLQRFRAVPLLLPWPGAPAPCDAPSPTGYRALR